MGEIEIKRDIKTCARIVGPIFVIAKAVCGCVLCWAFCDFYIKLFGTR